MILTMANEEKKYEINWQRCSDWGGHVPAGTLEITQDPIHLGAFSLWSHSLHQWEIDGYHKECKKKSRSNQWQIDEFLKTPYKKIKEIDQNDEQADTKGISGRLAYIARKYLVENQNIPEEAVDELTNEDLLTNPAVLKRWPESLRLREWDFYSSDNDTEAEYNWWLDKYKEQLKQIELTPCAEAKRWPEGDGYLIPNINEQKEPIPIQIFAVDGCELAFWKFSSEIETLSKMSQPPTREEWIDSVAILHNGIIEKLEPNWQKASQFYF